ncbi:hypothetical protein HZH68_000918 [Vespula germanica]|uniref:Uncharacterized protein n=1 Tax=Vespula germanica TaxID=30212 RepID=A0A834NUM8_VESGE|nr:hypothetical protein HZH68_000918 [Vespula germanica]
MPAETIIVRGSFSATCEEAHFVPFKKLMKPKQRMRREGPRVHVSLALNCSAGRWESLKKKERKKEGRREKKNETRKSILMTSQFPSSRRLKRAKGRDSHRRSFRLGHPNSVTFIPSRLIYECNIDSSLARCFFTPTKYCNTILIIS